MIKEKKLSINYPSIDPIALSIGPLSIRWYGIAYLMGIFSGYFIAKKLLVKLNLTIDISDFITSIVLGILIGGRLGYVLFYDFSYYLSQPLDIVAIWKGGMSFHGGALGAFIGSIVYCKKKKQSILKGLDILAISSTPGLFFGRVANFINAELFGRETTLPWGMIFPNGEQIMRHPSQLYEATLEGLGLFIILSFIVKYAYKDGRIFSLFVILYSIIRFFIEFTREPDGHLGLLAFNLSMGQILSIIMFVLGILWIYAHHKKFFYK